MPLDLEIIEREGWFYRRGLEAQDLTTVRTAYIEDEYHLDDVRAARSDEWIVDVGACIGAFSRRAHVRNPAARIVAVECHPHNAEVCRRNLAGISTATVVEAAMVGKFIEPDGEPLPRGLWDSLLEGTQASGGSIVGPLREIEAAAAGAEHDRRYRPDARALKLTTLDWLMVEHKIDYIDILKLDCEGSEYEILENAGALLSPRLLEDRVGLIVGEYHGGFQRLKALLHSRFGPSHWWTFTWNHHDHMGNFWIASKRAGGHPWA